MARSDRSDRTGGAEAAIAELRRAARPDNLAGMARYGIATERALGVPLPALRALARRIGHSQPLAEALWRSAIHEARILAVLVAEPAACDDGLLDAWADALDSWDLTDQFCNNLARRAAHPYRLIDRWCRRDGTFVRRAGFSLIASMAVHDKAAPDSCFRSLLPLVEAAAGDERNVVKKAVNWALRQIGKRNAALNRAAIACAERLAAQPDKTVRWIGRDALRELTSAAVQTRLAK